MLYIAGYTDIGSTTRGSIAIPLEPPVSEQAIEVGPNSVQSDPLKPDICIVKLLSDEDCMIDIGLNPDATNSVRKLKAGTERTITIPAGANFRIAAVASNSGSVTAMDSLESLLKLVASPADAQKQFTAMQDQVAKFTAAAQDLKAAGDEHRAMEANLVQATQDALNAKAAADKATAELAAREAAFDKDSQDHADAVRADSAAADERAKALDAREADLAASLADLNKKGADLADLASNLDARDKELTNRETIVAASQADYEARMAKLKALTG